MLIYHNSKTCTCGQIKVAPKNVRIMMNFGYDSTSLQISRGDIIFDPNKVEWEFRCLFCDREIPKDEIYSKCMFCGQEHLLKDMYYPKTSGGIYCENCHSKFSGGSVKFSEIMKNFSIH